VSLIVRGKLKDTLGQNTRLGRAPLIPLPLYTALLHMLGPSASWGRLMVCATAALPATSQLLPQLEVSGGDVGRGPAAMPHSESPPAHPGPVSTAFCLVG
jgi:hypothetical protein